MSWNNGTERKKFNLTQKKQAKEYADAGMNEMQIKAMYEFDLIVHKSERSFCSHKQSLTQVESEIMEGYSEEKSALLDKFMDKLSVEDSPATLSRFYWIEEIERPTLAKRIKKLSQDELDILTLLVIDGFSQAQIAQMKGCSQNAISKKYIKIKKLLK